MSLFVVTREAGPGWTTGGVYDQPRLSEHAAFMNALADEGVLLFGGPLAGSEHGRVRVLLIFDADSEAAIRSRLADDPWAAGRQLVTRAVDPWAILAGSERLSSIAPDAAR